jgi:hypothetical protein
MAPHTFRRIAAPAARRRRSVTFFRLRCEQLEDRVVPALFNVHTPYSFTGLNNDGCVVTADFNKDGRTDAVLTNFGTDYGSGAGSTITVLYGQQGGGFSHVTLNTGGTNPSFAAVGDLNGDGYPDLVVSDENGQNAGTFSVFLNDGAGDLSLAHTYQTSGNNPSWIGLAPILGDGHLDVVVGNFGASPDNANVIGNGITIFQGHGDGTFNSSPSTTLAPGVQFIPTALAIADFNGDGLLDIAAAVPGVPPDSGLPQVNGDTWVFQGTGSGGFGQPNQYDTGGVLPVNIQAVDLNGDGKPDLVVANSGDPTALPEWTGNSIGVTLNVSSATNVSFGVTNSLTTNCYGTFAVAVADFDLDGKKDIAAVNFGTQTGLSPNAFVSVYKGNGLGTFTPFSPGTFDTGTGVGGGQYLAVGDFDGNGTPDLIVAHQSNLVGLLLNTTTPVVGAASLAVSGVPTTTTAGSAFSATVTAKDANGNTVTGYTGTVHFTSTDTQAGLPSDYTFTAGDNGVHTFTNLVTLKTVGNQTVTATDTATSTVTGTSSAIAVGPASADHLTLGAPASASSGSAFSVTVTAKDPYGNTATAYRGTIHFTKTDNGTGSAVPADYTFVAGDTGSHTFSNGVTLVTLGSQTVTATDTGTSSITGSATVTVTAAAATHFSITAPASATAGAAFSITVKALDANGNTATGYTGTLHFTKTDTGTGSAVPADYTFVAGDNGVHTFTNGVTFVTAGNQTVTATDTGSSTLTGNATVTVNPAAASRFTFSGLPSLAITGIPFTFTLKAVDAFNNTVTGYAGTVHFTSSAAAVLPANSTLTNGSASFQATLNTTGSQTLTATDTVNNGVTGTSPLITVRGLIVTGFTATATGFNVTFSKAFINSSSSPINLYDSVQAGFGPADVTLVGDTVGNVRGSLVIDPTNTSLTFVKTGGPIGGGTTGLLAAGNYSVTIVSGRLAFRDLFNGATELLDGNSDGLGGDSYTTTFTVAASTAVAVTVPDVARGPDATHAINVPNNSTNGLPIALSNGAGVTDATFVLQYNANLLTITGGTVNPALTGATFTVTTSGSGTGAQATITFHSSTALAGGAVRLGGLTATVPANAPYKSKEVLHFSSLSLNGGAIPAVGDDGVHAVSFLGDATGDGVYTSADSVLISRVAAGADSGFLAFPILDPIIAADITGDGRITAADATALNLYLTGTSVPQVPTWPGVPSNLPAGPDPALSIPTGLQVGPGGTVTVPVLIDDPHPEGSSGLTQAVLALRYDPAAFSVSAADIHLGTVPAGGTGWTLQAVVDPTTGQIGITLFSLTPIASALGGSLVTIDFHAKPGAPAGASPVNLVPTVTINGRALYTALDDEQGPLTLHPAPTALATDPGVDSLVLVTAAPISGTVKAGGPVAAASPFVAPADGAGVTRLLVGTPIPQQGSLLGSGNSATQRVTDLVFTNLAAGASAAVSALLDSRPGNGGASFTLASPAAASPSPAKVAALVWDALGAKPSWWQGDGQPLGSEEGDDGGAFPTAVDAALAGVVPARVGRSYGV